MTTQSEFYLSTKASVIQYETLVISHPYFSQVYRIVRNAINGLVINGIQYNYYPLRITLSGSRENLDYGIKVDFGDLGEVIPVEIDRVVSSGSMNIKPSVIYSTYRSDTLALLVGPIILEIISIAMTREGASFEAKAPSLNVNRTGELYSLERFPTLKSFL